MINRIVKWVISSKGQFCRFGHFIENPSDRITTEKSFHRKVISSKGPFHRKAESCKLRPNLFRRNDPPPTVTPSAEHIGRGACADKARFFLANAQQRPQAPQKEMFRFGVTHTSASPCVINVSGAFGVTNFHDLLASYYRPVVAAAPHKFGQSRAGPGCT